MINARVETLVEKASFKYALTRRRCLIPADGFFEWKEEHTSTSRKKKQPMHIRMKDKSLFAFAGLWEEWRDKENPDDPSIKSATIITGSPNRLLSTLHHRMAVILEPEDEAKWLDPNLQEPEDILRLLKVFPDEAMEAFAISTRINTPAYDAPDCIEPMQLRRRLTHIFRLRASRRTRSGRCFKRVLKYLKESLRDEEQPAVPEVWRARDHGCGAR
jgi:putative SOS response-associated peptidase YedK